MTNLTNLSKSISIIGISDLSASYLASVVNPPVDTYIPRLVFFNAPLKLLIACEPIEVFGLCFTSTRMTGSYKPKPSGEATISLPRSAPLGETIVL